MSSLTCTISCLQYGNGERVVALYAEDATLLPTLSDEVRVCVCLCVCVCVCVCV